MKEKEYYLLQDVGSEVLLAIRRNPRATASEINDEVGTTYAHLLTRIKQFQELGLVNRQEAGRKKKIILTEEGEEVAEALQNLKNKLQRREL